MNKEYRSLLIKLSRDNRRTIVKMQHYLETCYINEVVYEDMMCDLAGMALECQERGEKFENSIGTDYKSFCRSLAVNAKKQTFPERFFDVLKWIVYFDGIIIPLLYVLYAIFGFTRPILDGLTLTAPAGQLLMYFSVATCMVLGFFIAKRFTYHAQTLVIFTYMAAVILVFLLTDFLGEALLGDMTLSVSLIAWGIVIGALLIICYLSRRLIATNIAYKSKK
ncbi:MAG: hypothetical protein IJZ89_06580 [Clostridia bacterium]|nr:hypothetical protein [Clostridia bacterium]